MSTDILEVRIAGRPAGLLHRLADNRLEFTYHDAYREAPDPTPLSTSMSTQIRTHTGTGLTNWLWGLLPDNDAVVERWARRFQVSLRSPFGLLSSPVGADCAGAVQFLTHGETSATGRVHWLDEHEIASRLAALRGDATAWLGTNFTGRFSLAGAQAKTALHREGSRWGEALGSTPTTHILKPAVTGFDDHDLNEHLCLTAAASLGLPTVHTEIGTFGDEQCIVVERYDRQRSTHEWVRVHQEDFCQALGVHPTAKYQAEGGPGPHEVVALLRRILPPPAAAPAIRSFADALVFNWIIAGTDAHAKNYSILLSGNQVRLAPLYDIASALPYGDHVRKLRLAMQMGGEYRLHGQRAAMWSRMADSLGLLVDELVERATVLIVGTPDAFADAVAALPDTLGATTGLPRRLVDEVARRAAWCRTTLPG